MAEEEDDDSTKTEEPTQTRLEEAFKKGRGIYSKEVTNFFVMFVFTIIMVWILPFLMKKTSFNLSSFFEHAAVIETESRELGKILIKYFGFNFGLILLPIILISSFSVLSSFLQNRGRFIFSQELIMPDLSRISPLKGLKRMFSLQSIIELIKSLIKIVIVSIVCYWSVRSELFKLESIHEQSINVILSFLFDLAKDIMISVCIILAIIAALDYLYQRYEFIKSLRMTKHELKEEYKQTEGNPEIKSKLKKIRLERSKKRMMAEVPKADVIITNPTHFAVALAYDQEKMRAPKVVAKGQDNLALKIKEIAKEHKIPIVENAPLARILYKEVDLDKEIDIKHYKAVAEIISYVYSLKNKKRT